MMPACMGGQLVSYYSQLMRIIGLINCVRCSKLVIQQYSALVRSTTIYMLVCCWSLDHCILCHFNRNMCWVVCASIVLYICSLFDGAYIYIYLDTRTPNRQYSLHSKIIVLTLSKCIYISRLVLLCLDTCIRIQPKVNSLILGRRSEGGSAN